MKKTKTWIATACMTLLAAFLMTGCSKDQNIGSMLEGTWQGQMGVYVEDAEGNTYTSTTTQMSFGSDPFRFTRGDGYWIDYYNYQFGWGGSYIASHIRWRVQDGVIKIHFTEDNYDIEITDYRINNGHFVGEIHTAEDYVDEVGNLETVYKDISFSMYKLSEEPDWSNIYFYDRGAFYYAPAQNGQAEQPKREVYKRHFRDFNAE